MKSIKIACISKGNDPRGFGGIETFQRVLYRIFKNNIYFYIFESDKPIMFDVPNIITVNKPKSIKEKILFKILGKTRYLSYCIKRDKPDIVIFNKPKDLRLLKNNKTIKQILIQHMDLQFYINTAFKSKDVINLICKKIDTYVMLSSQSEEAFSNFLKKNRNQFTVIPHSCEISQLNGQKKIGKNLVLISRFHNKQKRIDLAIKAMKKLPDFKLYIYGDGEDKSFLQNLINSENLSKQVFLLDKVTNIAETLDKHHIFVMTSDYEGYGIVNIEAMTRGLPIILRNTFESAEDIVQNNGILLPATWNEDDFVNGIKKIYENYDYYSANSIAMSQKYRYSIIEKKWQDLIEKLIKN